MVHKNLLLALLVTSAVCPTIARADDLAPPTWRLGNPSATVQEWDFVAPGGGFPDGSTWGSGGGGYVNPFGAPILAPSAPWLPAFGPPFAAPRTGVYELPGPGAALFFEVPNHGHPGGMKDIRVQISWLSPVVPGPAPALEVIALGAPFAMTPGGTVVMADGWVHSYYDITLPFCPSFETFKIFNPLTGTPFWIDQVVIDTICHPVPEPATMLALAFGAAALVAKRRRRK